MERERHALQTRSGQTVHFVHVPRTAGRSVAAWLGWESYWPQANHAKAPRGSAAFGVLRCPFERAVSEFRFRFPWKDPGEFELWTTQATGFFHMQGWASKHLLQGAEMVLFSDLESDLRRLLWAWDLPVPPVDRAMPHVLEHPNRPTEEPRPHPLEAYLTPAARDLIADYCAWDLEQLERLRNRICFKPLEAA